MQRTRSFLVHSGFVVVIISLLGVSELVAEDSTPISPTNKPINLLADDLSGFYTWLQDTKYEDPREVFTIDSGILRVSGDGWGGLTTKREYANYHMLCEFKWGEQTWGARKDRARDSGLLVHCIGPDGGFGGMWMASIEAQIIEGGVGDFLSLTTKHPVTLTAEITKDRNGRFGKREARKLPSGAAGSTGRAVMSIGQTNSAFAAEMTSKALLASGRATKWSATETRLPTS